MGLLANSIPRYHMQRNHIELVWIRLKRDASQLNSSLRLFDAEELVFLFMIYLMTLSVAQALQRLIVG
jgi:hypothetical protein